MNFSVQATQDTTDEPNEPFTVSLSDPVRATIETASVTTNIVDDDTPALSIGNAGAVDEGDTATFTVTPHAGWSQSGHRELPDREWIRQQRLVTSPPRARHR